MGSSAKEEALQRYLIKTLEKYREKTANERKDIKLHNDFVGMAELQQEDMYTVIQNNKT